MRYKVLVEGRNCLQAIEGKEKRLGFFATRIVEAGDTTASKEKALNVVETELTGKLLNHADDPPEFSVSEVTEHSKTLEDIEAAGGFTWYLETEH